MNMYQVLELIVALFFNASWFFCAWMMITAFAECDENTKKLFEPIQKENHYNEQKRENKENR